MGRAHEHTGDEPSGRNAARDAGRKVGDRGLKGRPENGDPSLAERRRRPRKGEDGACKQEGHEHHGKRPTDGKAVHAGV